MFVITREEHVIGIRYKISHYTENSLIIKLIGNIIYLILDVLCFSHLKIAEVFQISSGAWFPSSEVQPSEMQNITHII